MSCFPWNLVCMEWRHVWRYEEYVSSVSLRGTVSIFFSAERQVQPPCEVGTCPATAVRVNGYRLCTP